MSEILSSLGKALDQTGGNDGTEDRQSTSSSVNFTSECSPHSNTNEPESLVDFVLSASGQIPGSNSADRRMLVESYCKEYERKLRFLKRQARLLQRELKCDKEFRETQIIKASIEWNQARMQSAIDERLQHEKQQSIIKERILLLEELEENLRQWESDHPSNGEFSF